MDEAAQLRLQLASLWDRLEIEPEVRASFLENHPGFSGSARLQLREEIARCEELKKQNLEKFILRRVTAWWRTSTAP
jgi:Ase1/PRC1/MAP65 family protein